MDRRVFLKSMSAAPSLALLNNGAPDVTADKRDKNPAQIVASESNAVVPTTLGRVRGYTDKGIFTFKGIPYGQSPAGENRFLPPRKPDAWNGVRDALAYGPVCPQRPNKGWSSEEYAFLFQWSDGHAEEDCLRINIWTPSVDRNARLPVMFWIHGGAYFSGSAQEHPSYDGRNLSELGQTVVVSVNHRLNVFGFLDLSAYGDTYADSGNAGMLDLVAALEWVRDNAANFGGDPGNVTVFGQSGGAAKITTLMAMPRAKGLFHKAVSQSTSSSRVATHEYAAQLSKNVLDSLGIAPGDIDRLHRVSTQQLIDASIEAEKKMPEKLPAGMTRSGWQPVVDGDIVPVHPFEPGCLSLSQPVPMMLGSNRHEWSASIGNAALESMTEEDLRKKLVERYAEKGEPFLKVIRQAYPQAKPVEILSFLNPYNSMAHVLAEKKAGAAQGNVFLYMFSWTTPLLDGRPRAYHCSEIPFVFYNTDRCATMTGATPEARTLSEAIARAWIQFAKTGNPQNDLLPRWPPFTKANGETMILNVKSEIKNDPDRLFREYYRNL